MVLIGDNPAWGQGPRGDERARLAALDRYDVLDSPTESFFDWITALVRAVFDVPMAVSLIDRDRQWFKSHTSIAAAGTLHDIAVGEHTIAHGGPFIVPDARADPRFTTSHGLPPRHISPAMPGFRRTFQQPVRTGGHSALRSIRSMSASLRPK